jgi:hypothetical protein
MKEFAYQLTQQQQKKLFLAGYYNRPILWFQRRFAGPFLLIFGVLSFSRIVFSLVFILYGLYYIVRPFIMLARLKFKGSTLTLIFADEQLTVHDESGTLILKKEHLLKAIRKKNLLFLLIQYTAKQYLVFDLDNFGSQKEDFLREISPMVQKII